MAQSFSWKEKKNGKEPQQDSRSAIVRLQDMLFESMERLAGADLESDTVDKEIARSEALNKTANQVIATGRLALDYQKTLSEFGEYSFAEMPLIGMTNNQLIEENMNLRDQLKRKDMF